MSVEITVALIVSGLALLGTLITFLGSARRTELDILRGVIDELKEQIEELKATNADLEDWAERLVCQVKDLGVIPVKFIRHKVQREEHGK